MTTCWVSPESCEPDLLMELVTITAMYSGSGPAGGPALLPGSVLQPVPQEGAAGVSAKPLNVAGALPPLRLFAFAHCAPQNCTVPVALLSPMTNAPPLGAAPNTVAVLVAVTKVKPVAASMTLVVTVYVPAA